MCTRMELYSLVFVAANHHANCVRTFIKRPVKLPAQLARAVVQAAIRTSGTGSTTGRRQAPLPRQARWFILLCALGVAGALRRLTSSQFLTRARPSSLTTCRSMSRAFFIAVQRADSRSVERSSDTRLV